MKKILFFILISLPLITNAQTVDIIFLTTDGYWPLLPIRVGLDTTATNGLDPHLGEYELPNITGFSAAFDISQYTGNTTWVDRDYRPAQSFPFTGIVEHRLGWQLTIPYGIAFTMYYNFPPSVTANLKDEIGGIFFNENLSDSGSFTCPNNFISTAILTMYYNNVIPVELTSFTASILQNKKAVQLNWTTATETNNSGFEILRFTQNDNEWKTIGFVPGFGTTTEPKSYSFIDENVTTGTYNYRLKQIDFDGSFEFSNEIEVDVDFTPKEFVLYQNYPNPFNPSTVISYELPVSGDVTLKVYDILGNEVATLVNEEKPAGIYNVEFRIENLPAGRRGLELSSGIYFYQLKAGEYSETKKMILLK